MARKKPEAIVALEAIRPSCRCGEEARMRVQTGDGWENVCEAHYLEHFKQLAEIDCESWGIQRKLGENPKNYHMRVSAWLKEKAARSFKRMP